MSLIMDEDHGLTAEQIKIIIAFNYAEFMQGIDEFDWPEYRVYDDDIQSERSLAYRFGKDLGVTFVDWQWV